MTIIKADIINGNSDKPALYGNTFNQLFMKYHATGKAIKAEINASHK
jgi:hypothetical protein